MHGGDARHPPADMKQTIDITWTEMTGGFTGMTGARGNSRRIQTYKSWALDHVMWSQGNLNFCVRWDSTVTVTATMRDQVQATLQRGVDAWFSALNGYDCFPYSKVNVKVTGWAVSNRATLDWTDDTIVPIYVNQLEEGAPTCPATCSRFRHQDKNYDFAQCPGGAQNRFDQFVWLEQDYNAPNGWDMGAHVNQQGFTNTISGTGLYHIWLHEFGHGIGFPDYYDWSTVGSERRGSAMRDERRRCHHGHRLGQVDVQAHLERASAHEPLAVSRTPHVGGTKMQRAAYQ